MATTPGRNDRRRRSWSPNARRRAAVGEDWLWGWHAVRAALGNPARGEPRRLLASAERARLLGPAGRAAEILPAGEIGQHLPKGAAHQGVALLAGPLEPTALVGLASPAAGVLIMLDQVTDPQNVGAIFRSAAAFGARGVILQDRHAPSLAGALAKAAAGAIERVPHAREVNLARALERLADLGWRAVGLDARGADRLDRCLDGRPTVLVMGSEGEGLRRLVGEHCDVLARITMAGEFESLNVAAAAAVALSMASRADERG